MATITGLTAERMREIEAASIVSGTINASGNLILTRYDGGQIDAGNALAAFPDDAVIKVLAPGPAGYTESFSPETYPVGTSLIYITDSTTQGWSGVGFASGAVQTIRIPNPSDGLGRASQIFQPNTGYGNEPDVYVRTGIEDYGWTVWRKLATQKYVDDKVDALNTRLTPTASKLPTDAITTYPSGLSMTTMDGATGPTWSSIPSTQYGTIITANGGGMRSWQLMQVEDGYLHFRRWRDDLGGWRSWTKVLTEQRLAPADFPQSRVFTGYPWGTSYLYLNNTESSAGGWDFGGNFGLVITHRHSDDFAMQTYVKHASGTGWTGQWIRTANSSQGWTPWRIIARDNQLPDPQMVRYTNTNTISSQDVWVDIPTLATITLVLPFDAIVQVEYGAWLVAGSTANVRSGVSHNGANPQDLFGGSWGNVLYVSNGNEQHHFTATDRLSAGTHTFKARAYRQTADCSVNYPVLRVTPLRWAE